MINTALTLRYDGADFHGWQEQKDLRTVQETLRLAVESAIGQKISLIGCGRTDARVHAEKYTANFQSEPYAVPIERLPLALKLPEDIAVYAAYPVSEDFHAVFSCTRKEYTYKFHTGKYDPLLRNREYFHRSEPNVALWQARAEQIKGKHDFAAFRTMGTQTKTTVRTVFDCRVREFGDNRFAIVIAADGFLYNMARAIAGTVLFGGRMGGIEDILASKDRTNAGPTLPPQGLYMTDQHY